MRESHEKKSRRAGRYSRLTAISSHPAVLHANKLQPSIGEPAISLTHDEPATSAAPPSLKHTRVRVKKMKYEPIDKLYSSCIYVYFFVVVATKAVVFGDIFPEMFMVSDWLFLMRRKDIFNIYIYIYSYF